MSTEQARKVNDLIGPVHNSHLSALKQCEQKFDYSFSQQIEAKHPSLPLKRGVWIHYMLEAQHLRWGWQANSLFEGLPHKFHIDGLGDLPVVVSEEGNPLIMTDTANYALSAKGVLDLLTENVWNRLLEGEHGRYTAEDHTLPEACWRIVREYMYHYNKWPLPKDATILGVEQDWQREHHGVMYEGRIDLIYKIESSGLIVIRDWKTTSSPPDNDFKFMDSQLNLYPWGITPWLMENGVPVKKATHVAVEWDYLLTKLPTTPSINKDGSVSKRKVATTRLTLMDLVKNEGLKWKQSDIDNFLDAYTTGKEFFDQRLVPRNQSVINRLLEENNVSVDRMFPILNAERMVVRSVGRHCDYMCDFKPLCKGELYGDDVRYMRKKDYQPRNYLAFDRDKDE